MSIEDSGCDNVDDGIKVGEERIAVLEEAKVLRGILRVRVAGATRREGNIASEGKSVIRGARHEGRAASRG